VSEQVANLNLVPPPARSPGVKADRPRVYLAGKVNGLKWGVVGRFKSSVDFVASDGSNHSQHDLGVMCEEFAQYRSEDGVDAVENHFIAKLQEFTRLLAVLNRADSYGSIAEIAYASALGIRCDLIIFDKAARLNSTDGFLVDPRMYDAYWFISNFPGVRVHVVGGTEEAECTVEGLLRPYLLKGYVYILSTADGYFKIGQSRDVSARISRLRIQLPFPVELEHVVGTYIAPSKAESFLHNKFKHYRMNGEWFRLPREAVDWLKTLKHGSIEQLMG
jgi:hypothetical protein